MDETTKLRMLLPHWIEHNGEHAQEFKEHAALADEVEDKLLAAAQLMQETNARLGEALDELGGPLPHHHV
jgi:hypothetical protein